MADFISPDLRRPARSEANVREGAPRPAPVYPFAPRSRAPLYVPPPPATPQPAARPERILIGGAAVMLGALILGYLAPGWLG